MTHPGELWDRMAVRDWYQPLIWIDGRRSFVCGWPPGAVCERCHTELEPGKGGYAGPTPPESGTITYPRNDVRYVCISCARSMVGLGPAELTDHGCSQACRDGLCVHLTIQPRGVLGSLDPTERIEHFAEDFAQHGWRVVAVERESGGPVTTGENWAIAIKPARDGVWPV